MLKPADLCGWSSESIRALNRARRSAQHTASASATVQPNRGANCSDQKNTISAGAVPNAMLSLSEFELGAEFALGAKQPGDPAVHSVEHAGEDDEAQRAFPILGKCRSARRSGRSTAPAR